MPFEIKNVELDDYERIINVMPSWWGGRDLTFGLSKIYFIHFRNSSFVAIKENKIIGFLVGFMSQNNNGEAYIQLAGVDPSIRKQGVGKALYQNFYKICKMSSVSSVTSCTSPINILSIEFHKKMGFEILKGNFVQNGYEVTRDYLGPGNHKVLFRLEI